jgi:hypothetical protein
VNEQQIYLCPPKAKVTRSNRVGCAISQRSANYAAGSPLHRFQLSGNAVIRIPLFHSLNDEPNAPGRPG